MRGVRFERSFSAAHRIWNDPSVCSRIHGHNYRVTVHVRVSGSDGLTTQGFVVPFDEVKRVIDAWDHRLLLHDRDPNAEMLSHVAGLGVVLLPVPPSTENLAQLLAEAIREQVPALAPGVHVKLQENDSISASWLAE